MLSRYAVRGICVIIPTLLADISTSLQWIATIDTYQTKKIIIHINDNVYHCNIIMYFWLSYSTNDDVLYGLYQYVGILNVFYSSCVAHHILCGSIIKYTHA